ncbi:MAG: hypothetical protein JOZ22_04640 [Acidobacteriia bacterium]|nr:hypothetical protein [Terriglobia bacterium]
MGRSPYANGHRATTIPTIIIPVIFTFADTGEVFDPTSPDPCAPNKDSIVNLINGSPLISSFDFVENGVSVGKTQYLDAFERGNFWGLIGGTPYHSLLNSNPLVIPYKVTVPKTTKSTPTGMTVKYAAGCRDYGLVDANWLQTVVQNTIFPALAAQGVGPTSFPQILTDSVFESLSPEDPTNIALGYHTAYTNGDGVLQTWAVNGFDTSGRFSGSPDLDTMSHEVAEWLDDPITSNATPAWGGAGQVDVGKCQSNLEVGDPTSEGGPTPSNQFLIKMPNGFTYTLQELTYFSWFFHQSPSLGSGGKYSNNGAFNGFAKPCPPGGTN